MPPKRAHSQLKSARENKRVKNQTDIVDDDRDIEQQQGDNIDIGNNYNYRDENEEIGHQQDDTDENEELGHTDHKVITLPKFHPELNAIERLWARIKAYIRPRTDGKIETLRTLLREAFRKENLPIRLIRKWCRLVS